jgi:hypothetical protein
VARIEEEEEEDEKKEEVEVEMRHRTSEEWSSFSGRASNSLSSLGHYPFSFRHPPRGKHIVQGSPPFVFSRSTATPHSKSTSIRATRETRSTGNVETTSHASSPSGALTSRQRPSSFELSPHEHVRGMSIPSRHPVAGAISRRRAGNVPVSPTSVKGLTATGTSPQQQAFEEHCQHLRASVRSEDGRSSRSCNRRLMARSRRASAKIRWASFLGLRNGSTASLARIGSAFRSRSRSRHASSGSGGTGTGSGASSRHNSHVSLSNVSLALGRARAQSLIHGIGSASRSSLELVLGRTSGGPGPGAVRLSGGESSDASEGALSNPESHTFGVPVVGGAGISALPRRVGGARARARLRAIRIVHRRRPCRRGRARRRQRRP